MYQTRNSAARYWSGINGGFMISNVRSEHRAVVERGPLVTRMLRALIVFFAIGTVGFSLDAWADSEIRIGQTLPYSGPASGFGNLGKAQEAYFAKLNAEGGIGGRKIRLLTVDDAYSPSKTVEQTRRLVEQEDVLAMFGSLGSGTNSAVHRYLNRKGVPQLFVLSGATKWNDPKNFPWTMPGMPAYEAEGALYGRYVLQNKPDAKVGILAQNDDLGRDYIAGFKSALGERVKEFIVAEVGYETSAPTISSQLMMLRASGANVLLGVTLGKFTTQMIKGVSELGWKPDLFFVPTSSSSVSFLEPAGLQNAAGLLSAAYSKDVSDSQWADSPDVREYYAFMKHYLPNADATNGSYAGGYMYANLLAAILKACNGDFSRENIMRQATSLRDLAIPLLLPDVRVTTSTNDYRPFRTLQMRRFDGKTWVGLGNPIDVQ
jgi:branched-chain amino acid transport system substrate-binding protein